MPIEAIVTEILARLTRNSSNNVHQAGSFFVIELKDLLLLLLHGTQLVVEKVFK